MVNAVMLGAVQGVAAMWGISPTNAVYVFAFLFSLMFGIAAAGKTGKPLAGAGVGFISLVAFGLMDAFPLWLLALPVLILVVVKGYDARRG